MSEATNKTKKRKNAFTEMMEAARMQPAAKKPRRQPANAFDEMMHASKEPGAFGPQLDIKALKSNAGLRQIIAEVLEEDAPVDREDSFLRMCDSAKHAYDCTATRSVHVYEDDPTVREAKLLFFDYDRDLPVVDDRNEDERGEEEVNTESIFPSLKPPPKSPAKNAALKGIVVHFRCEVLSEVSGFTFRYSDGVEVCVGEIRGTVKARVKLDEEEHIVGVKPFHRQGNGPPSCVERILFRTSKGRWLLTERGKTGRKGSISRRTLESNEGELTVDTGTVLRSIDWNENSLTIKGLNSVLIADIDGTDASGCERVPSLATLARQSFELSLRTKAEQMDEKRKLALRLLKRRVNKEVEEVYHEHRRKLDESEEVAALRQARSILEKAERRVKVRGLQLLKSADSKGNSVKRDFLLERDDVNRSFKTYQKKVLDNDRRPFVEYASLTEPAEENNALTLCASPECRKSSFRPNLLPKHRRCSVTGCSFANFNCGCETKPCVVCHESYCKDHSEKHRLQCISSDEQKCGYCPNDNRLEPACCHKESSSLRSCTYCETMCCEDCSEVCTCSQVWCNRCTQPGGEYTEHECEEDDVMLAVARILRRYP